MTFYDLLVETLLVCKKTFGADFDNLNAIEKQAIVLKAVNELMRADPEAAKEIARMYLEDVQQKHAE